jgi:hypothetical protein
MILRLWEISASWNESGLILVKRAQSTRQQFRAKRRKWELEPLGAAQNDRFGAYRRVWRTKYREVRDTFRWQMATNFMSGRIGEQYCYVVQLGVLSQLGQKGKTEKAFRGSATGTPGGTAPNMIPRAAQDEGLYALG